MDGYVKRLALHLEGTAVLKKARTMWYTCIMANIKQLLLASGRA